VVSAGVVYLGTAILQLSVSQFAFVNTILTLVWIGIAIVILRPSTQPSTSEAAAGTLSPA
jgi:hypothetical protein